MGTENRTEVMVREVYEHVVGKNSKAWEKWWEWASRDLERLGIALYGALLSLGAPPHPNCMTQDLVDIQMAVLPNRNMRHRAYRRALIGLDDRIRRQSVYNRKLNNFAKRHGLIYIHKTHDPAQFRKLFAAFVLHAYKEMAGGEAHESKSA